MSLRVNSESTRHDDDSDFAISQCVSVLPLLHRPRRHLPGSAVRTSSEQAFADQCSAVRPIRSAQPPHRRRLLRTINLPQLAHRARGAQIPIAFVVPPHVHPARFPLLEAFGRRPSACAAPSLIGPASETLHNTGHQRTNPFESASRPSRPFTTHDTVPESGRSFRS